MCFGFWGVLGFEGRGWWLILAIVGGVRGWWICRFEFLVLVVFVGGLILGRLGWAFGLDSAFVRLICCAVCGCLGTLV